MQVVCQSHKRSELAMDGCRELAEEVARELDIGMTYEVYSQSLIGDCVMYLIAPRDRQGLSRPSWYPAAFFSVLDGSIPSSWVFSYKKENETSPYGVVAIWGYLELVVSDDHFRGLIEREEDALLMFVRRKAEIDAESKMQSASRPDFVSGFSLRGAASVHGTNRMKQKAEKNNRGPGCPLPPSLG